MKTELNFKKFEEFAKKLTTVGVNVENVCRIFFENTGYKITEEEIYRQMPCAYYDKRNKRKKHAKRTSSLKHISSANGFVILPNANYRYLVFPNDALGTSVKKRPQLFFDKALEQTEDKVIEMLLEKITNEIERSIQ